MAVAKYWNAAFMLKQHTTSVSLFEEEEEEEDFA